MANFYPKMFLHATTLGLLLAATTPPAPAANTLEQAIVDDGDIYANFRYRYEHVDDDLAPEDADASTLRSVLGYRSGAFYGLSVLLEGEQVSRIGGSYREFPGQASTREALVADPDSTELNQGYLQYSAPAETRLRAGRQIITYRDAPFHRFIGTVLWRQNWQTFDAVSVQNSALPDTTASYAYIWNVNRIFGDNSAPVLSDFDSDSHLFNIQFDRFSAARLEGYTYILDFDNAPAASSATVGGRLNGEYDLGNGITPLYTLEYAHQRDHADNPGDYDVGYRLIEGGFRFKPGVWLDSLVLKGSYEYLEGNGTFAFQTPLGTNHAFQGTADRFLSTPRDGIRDFYGSAVARAWGFKLVAAYHVLESDKFDYSYGDEIDVQLTRGIGKHFTVGAKYADYDADTNATNLSRNGIGTVTADVQKLWLFVVAKF